MGYKIHSNQEEQLLVQEYLAGAPVKTLMEKYGYKTKKSITDKVKKYQSIEAIQIARENRKNYKITFDGITNIFNAYFLGLMLTDGYIQNNNQFGIDLTDEDCIQFISKVTNKTYNSYTDNQHNKTRHRLIFSNSEVVKKLGEYGVVPNKSKILHALSLTTEEEIFLPYLIRGIIDGDGCIYKTSYGAPAFYICSASKDFIIWIKQTLENKMFFKELSLTCSTEGLWRIDTADQHNMFKLLALIYDKPYGMSRKYVLLRKMFRDYNKDDLLLDKVDGIVQTTTEMDYESNCSKAI